PRWGTGPSSNVDFGARDPSGVGMDCIPKLRASYFVNVRGQGEATPSGPSVAGLISQSSTIGSIAAADTRPFEEIKRMRLSQALDDGINGGAHQHDGMKMVGLTPSPTYSTSGRAPHFDTARLTPRFSPGKGVKVSGFPSSLNCRPSTFGGSGLALGPLSPSLTEPPTPPSHWQMQEPEAFASKATDGGGGGGLVQASRTSAESEQGVLPMAQRPMDEVNAVQALMSVGLGTRAQLEVVPAAAVVVPEQAGVAPGPSVAGPAVVEASEASRSPVPSLERLKPFEGGVDDDDDGLDKDLWVVVEKGSLCTSPD
ncbi:unnamed protein product, partial [Hapterophycus canaliculatus]